MRQEKFIEGAFSVQKQPSGKGKQHFNQRSKAKHEGGNNNERSKQKFPPCKHCKKPTHLEKYCWWRPDAVCGSCKQLGHISKVCKSKKGVSKPSQAQVAEVDAQEEQLFAVSFFSTNYSSDTWLLDSGCTHHLCNDAEMFRFFDDTYRSKVKVGNGEALEVKGRGTVAVSTISGIKTIPDVLYTPDISQNLLSVGQMLEKNYSLHFKDHKCVVFDPSGVELLCVKMNNRIFAIDWEKVTEQANTSISQTTTNLWHKRFGHFNQRSIAEMKKKELVENMPEIFSDAQVCETCQLGKQTKLPFQANQVWRANQKLQLIHTDVCGPMNIKSMNGNRYFLLFIDDCTRMCWVYFIKHKSEVFNVFKQFKALVENQCNLKIKALRSDNGEEYTSAQFVEFCNSEGIEHQLTLPYTPQQNGVSERKNRTVMEMARCLLIERNLPNQFWAEAVNTSIYLLNRLPTKVVQDKTPYEAWYDKKPSVHHLRIFGCICYYQVPECKRSKLDNKARKGIFMGYGSSSKGYRIFCLKTEKIILSREVGKTTLCKALYNKLASHFTHRTFILNVKELVAQQGIVSLQKKIINGLSNASFSPDNAHQGRVQLRRIIQEKRVLLVLDDVDKINDDVNILKELIGGKKWFFEGSRVVISTRNREVLLKDIVNETFEVRELGKDDSLKLFSHHAFRRQEPSPDFVNISKKIVSIARGLPLALEVFGSFLFDKRSDEEWQDALEKLKQIRSPRLQDILKISYDGLDDEEKCIFLDVACLFILDQEMKAEDVIDVMKGCGFRAAIGFNTLTARSLVKIIDGGNLWMHDQIRDMGRQIVLQQGVSDPGKRSRLWDAADVLNVLQGRKGTKHIQGIILDLQQQKLSKIIRAKAITRDQFKRAPSFSSALAYIKELYKEQFQNDAKETNELILNTEVFDPLINLRLLQFGNVKLEGNLGKLPSSLKWLQWKRCTLSSYYSNDYPSELAILDLSGSQIEKVGSRKWTWSGNKVANKLIIMNLSGCHKITAIPDLSMHKALEKLIAKGCSALQSIHRSIGNLKTLRHLNLRDCHNLVEFPSEVSGLKNLEILILSGCLRLKQLPEDIGKMKSLQELLFDETAIEKLPESIFRLTKLERLSLNNCRSFKRLPQFIGKLSALKELILAGSAVEEVPDSIEHLQNLHTLSFIWCKSVTVIPHSIGNLKSLARLWLYGSSIETVPESIGSLYYLRSLTLGNSQHFTALPDSVKGLSSLVELQIDKVPILSLPDHIGALRSLKNLEIRNCERLGSLPDSIGELLALRTMTLTRNDAIMELPESIGKLQNLVILRLTRCKKLKKLPASIGELKNLVHLLMEETAITELPETFGMLSSLMILKMGKKPFSQVPQSTKTTEPVVLPYSFSELSLLKELDARAWRIVGKIPDDFEKLSSLEIINLGHNDFSYLPSSLKEIHFLKELLIPHCNQLKALPPLPSSLLKIDAANCGALERIYEISQLEFLRELNLANCMSLVDIQGIECLKSLRWLHMVGCNASCASIVRSKLDKVALKNMYNFSIPGIEIPRWLTPNEVHFSKNDNNELKAVIIAILVSVNNAIPDDLRDKLPVIPNIHAKIIRANRPIYTTAMYLAGVPTTPEDQVYLCRFLDYHPLVSILQDGDIIQVTMGNFPIVGIELKKCGIHLVYESDDDYEGNEELLDESQQSVSERLTRFIGDSNRETNILSSNPAQEEERMHDFLGCIKEIFCALKYLLFR